MTFGNFYTTEGTPALEVTAPPNIKQGKKEYSYYFVDDVGVYQTGSKPEAFTSIVVMPEKGIMRNEPAKFTEAKIESVKKQPADSNLVAVNNKKLAAENKPPQKETDATKQEPVQKEADIEAMLAAAENKTPKEEKQVTVTEADIEAALAAAEKKPTPEKKQVKATEEAEVEAALAAMDKKEEVISNKSQVKSNVTTGVKVADEKTVEAALAAMEKKDARLEAAATESAVETALQRKEPKKEVSKHPDNYREAVGSKKTTEAPKPTILKYLFFEKNSARILPESEDQLIMLADILMSAEGSMVEISGHTDESGTEEGNQKLSLSRAQAVVNFMVMLDIDAARMSYKGYGSTRPIADNKTEEGRNKNRRVEFLLINK